MDQLIPYNEETRKAHGQKRRMSTFNEALFEIESDPKKPIKRRPKANDSTTVKSSKKQRLNGYDETANGDVVHDGDGNEGDEKVDSDGSEVEGPVSRDDGLASCESFCKYIAQFECTTAEQIQSVRDMYANTVSPKG